MLRRFRVLVPAVFLAAALVGCGSANAATRDPQARAAAVQRPQIVQRPIPFGALRKREMTAYSRRHYGGGTYRLVNPKVIVEHFTATTTFSSAYNTFAQDRPDPELHELPGTCAHFIIDTDGTIYQLVSLSIRCRHTVGLNWTSIGIENVGMSDEEILNRPAQMHSIIALTRWLRCREGIGVNNVIGHNESLSSPYHRENVPSLRRQTHGDWTRPHMNTLRRRLRAAGSCTPLRSRDPGRRARGLRAGAARAA